MRSRLPLPVLACLLANQSAFGQTRLPLDSLPEVMVPGQYFAQVPTPEQVMGHQIGSRHSRAHQIHEFFAAVDAASDRVKVQSYGQSHDRRKLIYAVVSSPRNLARIEEIRKANLRLSENPSSVRPEELATMPTVLWMGYGVHGNEASTPEAAVLFLYHLAASNDPALSQMLDNVVVIVDPLYNPDGHDRHVNWLNLNRGTNATADPNHREHNEPWPNGRTNKFMFDLNRDWLPATQPESQARLQVYHAWRPQLLGDYHEMGADRVYYFHPGIPTRNNPNTPEILNRLTDATSKYLARELDVYRVPYYTRESFDDFYYGKGSSYPDINGAVGVLFEQGSSRALVRETSNGLFRFPDTIRNQFATSLGMLRAASEMRSALLGAQREIYAAVPEWAKATGIQGYVVSLTTNNGRGKALVATLARHGVQAFALREPVQIGGSRFEPADSVVLPLRQTQGRLLWSAMDRRTTFPDTGFYDVSSWHLGYAMNATFAEWTRETVAVGSPWLAPATKPANLPEDAMAYALEWGSEASIRTVCQLALDGYTIGLMRKPMQIEGERLSPGQVVVSIGNGQVFPKELNRLQELGVAVRPIRTALTNVGDDGGDLGSPSLERLARPRVAILSGSGTSANAVGEAWHALNHRWGLPVTLLDSDRAALADLSQYSAIVVTDGASATLTPILRTYAERGGVLVTTGTGASWAVAQSLLPLRARPEASSNFLNSLPFAELEDARRSLTIPGTILQTELDVTHPLAFGAGATVPVLRRGNTFFESTGTPGVVIARYAENPLLAGYLHPSQLPRAKGAVAMAATRLGSGSVIAIMDNPNFRGFWLGTGPLFANAVLFGKSF